MTRRPSRADASAGSTLAALRPLSSCRPAWRGAPSREPASSVRPFAKRRFLFPGAEETRPPRSAPKFCAGCRLSRCPALPHVKTQAASVSCETTKAWKSQSLSNLGGGTRFRRKSRHASDRWEIWHGLSVQRGLSERTPARGGGARGQLPICLTAITAMMDTAEKLPAREHATASRKPVEAPWRCEAAGRCGCGPPLGASRAGGAP